ncbi:MAG: ATP-binding protein [Nitrospinales bacterium]
MKRGTQTFLLLSVVIIVLDLIFVWINYKSSKEALQKTIVRDGKAMEITFARTLDSHATDLQKMAAFVSGNSLIQSLLLRAKRAIEEEGGGVGGEKSRAARNDLYENIEDTWEVMRERGGVRQLTFYLAPSTLVFLRAHDPERFGDRMDKVRLTIMRTNSQLVPTRGFEAGREDTGVRGVVPIFADDSETDENVYVGAVEAVRPISVVLADLDQRMNAGFAVLLNRRYLKSNLFPEILEKRLAANPMVGDFFVEASSRPGVRALLKNEEVYNLADSIGIKLVEIEGSVTSILSFPMRDFIGLQNPNLPDAGRVLVWQRGDPIQAYEKGVKINIAYAIIGFIIIEALLFFVLNGYEKLTWTINKKSLQLQSAHDELERRVEELKDYRERLRELNNRQQAVREEEKTRIAREVHDELGQALTALKMELACVESELGEKNEALRERTRAMGKLIDGTVTSVQRICIELRPQILDVLGLRDAMEWLAQEFQKRNGIQCDMTWDNDSVDLSRDHSTTFFRIFQETLTNVARHSEADHVWVSFKNNQAHMTLEVKDNGKGIKNDQARKTKSFGLMGIRERAILWGGEVNIRSAPGEGTTVSVKIPKTPPQEKRQ